MYVSQRDTARGSPKKIRMRRLWAIGQVLISSIYVRTSLRTPPQHFPLGAEATYINLTQDFTCQLEPEWGDGGAYMAFFVCFLPFLPSICAFCILFFAQRRLEQAQWLIRSSLDSSPFQSYRLQLASWTPRARNLVSSFSLGPFLSTTSTKLIGKLLTRTGFIFVQNRGTTTAQGRLDTSVACISIGTEGH